MTRLSNNNQFGQKLSIVVHKPWNKPWFDSWALPDSVVKGRSLIGRARDFHSPTHFLRPRPARFSQVQFLLTREIPRETFKNFLECDGNERKMKSDHAQLPVAPPRKISEKNKKSPKNTIDPKNAQQFIENFVNQVKILISPSKFGLYLPQNNYYINLDRYRLLSVARGFSCIFQKIGPVSNFSSKNFRNLSLTMYQLEVILKFHSLFISLFYRLAKIF